MHDTLQAARERARQWREAQDPPVADGLVIVLDGLFVGWAAGLPPAELWALGCLAIAGDGQAYLIDQRSWRDPLQWFDLDPPGDFTAGPPPSPTELPGDSAALETKPATDP